MKTTGKPQLQDFHIEGLSDLQGFGNLGGLPVDCNLCTIKHLLS